MSLYVYSGVPGSGKSYHACRDLLMNRAPSITNMKVDIDNVAVLDLKEIKPDMLMAFSLQYFENRRFRENELLLVIDEAQLLFNSRSWADKDRYPWLEFLSQHRHYGYKVVLVAQDITMIDKQFRCLCEYDVRHTAAGSISVVTRALALVGLKLTCAKYYFFESDVLIMRDFYRISKRVYRHYDTRQNLVNVENAFSDVDTTPITSKLEPPAAADALGGECAAATPPALGGGGEVSQEGKEVEPGTE